MGQEVAVDQYKTISMRYDTSEPQRSLNELNKQWVRHVRQQQNPRLSRQDDLARHAAIINIAECLVTIKSLLGMLLFCTLFILLCTLFILWKGW